MKKAEYKWLEAYFKKVDTLNTTIQELQRMIQGILRRINEDKYTELRISVQGKRPRKYPYDSGIYLTLPESVLRDAFLPVLQTKLAELKEEFRQIPLRERERDDTIPKTQREMV